MCTNEINILNDKNVMESQTSDTFERASLLTTCLESEAPFEEFCLYPPADNSMLAMCAGPTNYDPTFLFNRMLDNELISVNHLPRIISFETFAQDLPEWVPLPVPTSSYGILPEEMHAFTVSVNGVRMGVFNGQLFTTNVGDALLRKEPGVNGADNMFAHVCTNQLANVQAALFSDTGLFIRTTASERFVAVVPDLSIEEEKTCFYHTLLLWQLSNSTTGLAVAYQTHKAIYLDIFEVSPSKQELELKHLVPYRKFQVVIAESYIGWYNPYTQPVMTAGSLLAWCTILSSAFPNEPASICLTYSRSKIENGQYFMYTINTSPNLLEDTIVFFSEIDVSNASQIPSFGIEKQHHQKWFVHLNYSQLNGLQSLFINAEEKYILEANIYNQSNSLSLNFSPTLIRRLTTNRTGVAYLNNGSLYVNYSVLNVIGSIPYSNSNSQFDILIMDDSIYLNLFLKSASGHLFRLQEQQSNTWGWVEVSSLMLDKFNVDERVYDIYNNWFLGKTFASSETHPPLRTDTPMPHDFLLSRHSLFKLTVNSYVENNNNPFSTTSPIELGIRIANVWKIMTSSSQGHTESLPVIRTVRLYDSGNIRILDHYTETNLHKLVWSSGTNDHEGSDVIFETLSLNEQDQVVAENVRATSSPNGRYILFADPQTRNVVLAFNPFNAPRFTAWTAATGKLEAAVAAQSQFCFRVLNRASKDPLKFLDFRCACLSSDRLLDRVFPKSSEIPSATRLRIREMLPCQLQDCKAVVMSEYTNANKVVGKKCLASMNMCTEFAPASVFNILVSQDCEFALRPCQFATDCPLGANCVKGQCVQTCSSDNICLNANPLARCVNGQCVLISAVDPESKTKQTQYVIIAIVLAVCLFILIASLVYIASVKK